MAISSRLLELDRGGKLVRTSNTVVTLGSLTVNTALTGAGGLDTGSIAANTMYYVYSVVSNNAVALVASTSATGPAGFTTYKKVGAFYTDAASTAIFKAYYFGEVNIQTYVAYVDTGNSVSTQNGSWISSVTGTTNKTITYAAGFFSSAPLPIGTQAFTGSPTMSIRVTSIALGSCAFSYPDYNGNVGLSSSSTIQVTKTGIDAVQPDWSR